MDDLGENVASAMNDRAREGRRRTSSRLFVLVAGVAISCGGGRAGAPVPTPSAAPSPTPRPAALTLLRLPAGVLGFGLQRGNPVVAPDGNTVAYTLEDPEEFFFTVFPGEPPRMAVIYCYRALAWRDSTTAVELGPDPGCPFPEPNPLAEWFGDSWPAALSADGAIGLLNRAQAAPPPIYKTFSFGFAGADETWEEVAWQSNHPDGERPPNASANDITPDGSVVVGTGWLESPFPGFDPSDARAWLYRPGDVGPTWLPWSGDRIESAIAVSDDGATIAGCCADPQNDDRTLPVLWHGDEPPVTLASPPGVPPPCVVNDLSGDGSVAVGRCDSIAVRWVDGEPFEIPVPPDDPPGDEPPAHEALAVSRDGSVVLGSSFFTGGPPGGWLWTEETGARSVHDVLAGAGLTVGPDQQLRNAVAMSADGKVLVGFAEEGRGASHAAFLFRAVLP